MKSMFLLTMLAINNASALPAPQRHPVGNHSRTHEWGIHTCIDLHACSYNTTRSTRDLETFARRVFSFIGVTPVGQPHTLYHYAGYGYSSGYSLLQHANGHTDIAIRVNEKENAVYIDVFSCKDYDAHQLARLAQDYFGSYEAEIDILYRR